MSGTSVIQHPQAQESCNLCDVRLAKNGYRQQSTNDVTHRQQAVVDHNDLNSATIVKILNVRDSKSTNYCLDKLDVGLSTSKRQLSDENDLKDLLRSFEECPYYKHILNSTPSPTISPTKQQEYWDQFYSFPRLFVTENNASNHRYQAPEPFVLQPSLFHKNHVPPTIFFKTKLTNESGPPIGLPKCLQHMFKWKISSITPNTIRTCVLFMKFETIRPSNTTDNSYLGSWCKHMPTADFNQLDEWRKVNHYPGSFHMGRKDKLWSRLKLANQKFEDLDLFHPITFVLPRDYEELDKYWKSSPSNLFIMKPPASARGNGVQVINDISQIPESALKLPLSADGTVAKKSTIIVQQYISNPCLLENGQKFDLRVYVLITSVDPLRIYVYEEGLVRFASSKYTSQEDGIIDQYMHLTNYFVNKNNQEYKINNDCESLHGCKWTLKRFWRYIKEHYDHVNVEDLWESIIDIIIKTIISCENPMTRFSHQNCKNDYSSYELFGFDIILDENFKPWILEVNITPSLKSESNLDTAVKFRVIQDMFNLVGYHLPPSDYQSGSNESFADHRLFFDKRLYTPNLTRSDKFKHLKYQKLFKLEGQTRRSSLPHQQQADLVGQDQRTRSTQPTLAVSDRSSPGVHQSSDTQGDRQQSINPQDDDLTTESNLDQCSDEESSSLSSKLMFGESILSNLTQSDVRVLMLAEDELSRCGQFRRVFPSATSSQYLKYFDKPRYYNLLLDAWEQKYNRKRLDGIKRLSKQATFLD